MSAYTVREVTSEVDRDKYGNVSYFVALEGVEHNALLKHKGDKLPKQPGDTLEGYELEEKTSVAGNKYYKLTRPQAASTSNGNGGGGGYRGDLSPEAQARIDATGRAQGRAHAQEMSLRYVDIKSREGAMPEGWGKENLLPLIDWFYNDAQAAKEQKP